MKYLVILIVSLLTITSSYSNEWEEVFKVTGVPKGIECPDTNNCYIVTDLNNLYGSSNKGKNWTFLTELTDKYNWVKDISVPDSSNIFVAHFESVIYQINNDISIVNDIRFNDTMRIQGLTMFSKDIGFMMPDGPQSYITYDGWKTYHLFRIENKGYLYNFRHPVFLNDSILFSLVLEYNPSLPIESTYQQMLFLKLNIKTYKYELSVIDDPTYLADLCLVNENLLFACGKKNTINGGSGHDVIYKSTDAGRTWRCVLDLYYHNRMPNMDPNPFGVQSIDFKDSLTGIAVGQFGKIVYTYDGGESWIYEDDLPPKLGGGESNPPTMIVRYSGNDPIIASFGGETFIMTNDDLSPGAEDIYSIRGRVWEGDEGKPHIPIAIGYQVTMTDSLGYYKFSNLSEGTYSIRVLNKFNDFPNQPHSYKPFSYSPENHVIELSSDTTGIDFSATDQRGYYSISGRIHDLDDEPVPGITVTATDPENDKIYTTITDNEGRYRFDDLLESWVYHIDPFSEDWTFRWARESIYLRSDSASVDFLGYRVGGDPGYYTVSGYLRRAFSNMPVTASVISFGDLFMTPVKDGLYALEHVKGGKYYAEPYTWLPSEQKYVPNVQEIVVDKDIDSINFIIKLRQQDTAYISGNVYNADTTAAANIALKLGEYESTSNQNGVYLFDNIPKGQYRLEPVSELEAGLAYNPPYYDIDLYSDKDTVRFFIEPVSSVEEQEHEGININTSIVNDNIRISISSQISSNNLNISVFTVQGTKLLSKGFELAEGENQYQIPTDMFETGLYIINITADGSLLGTEKVIIVR